MGHDVTLLATGDSHTSAKLISIFPHFIRSLPQARNMEVRSDLRLMGVGRVLEYLKKNKFDLVHNHIGCIFLPFVKCIDEPVVTTFHGFLRNPNEFEIYKHFADFNYVSISMNQRESAEIKLNFISNVYNGIDVDNFIFFRSLKITLLFWPEFLQKREHLKQSRLQKRLE